jgi:hypothetical protein
LHDDRAVCLSDAQAEALVNEGVYRMQRFVDGGWVTGLRYEDEVMEDLKGRTGGKEDEVAEVDLKKYASVSPAAFGLTGSKRIAVVRTSGAGSVCLPVRLPACLPRPAPPFLVHAHR